MSEKGGFRPSLTIKFSNTKVCEFGGECSNLQTPHSEVPTSIRKLRLIHNEQIAFSLVYKTGNAYNCWLFIHVILKIVVNIIALTFCLNCHTNSILHIQHFFINLKRCNGCRDGSREFTRLEPLLFWKVIFRCKIDKKLQIMS